MHLYGYSNGGSAVINYEIQWDKGSTSLQWETLAVGMGSQVVVSTGITSGQLYGFKYRA